MHETFYQLSAEPFRLSPDPRFCYQHRTYRKAMTYMHHAFQRAEGFIMITGRPGTGKTTLIHDLLRTLKPEQAIVASLVTTQMKADDLLRLVAYSFNLDPGGEDKVDVLVRLDRFLKQQFQQGRRPLLIVDEAQDMAEDALEELRLLTNIQAGGQPLLQVFLIGQEQLRNMVDAPSMEPLRQRMIAATHLESLDRHDTEAYIKHRLRRVAWTGDPLISKEAYAMIQQYSQGIPRQINQICSRLFLHGSIEEKHRLGIPDVMIVVEELRQEFLMPMETAGMATAVPWPADQHQETYEEEPARQSPPAAPKRVPQPMPPTTKARQETAPSSDTPPEQVTAREQERPLDQAEPEKKKTRKRSSWWLPVLTGLITGLALAVLYTTNPASTWLTGKNLMAWVHSGIQKGVSIATGESSPDITEPDEDMGKGTVVRESPPVSHEPGTDAAEIEIAVQEPDLPQANPLQLEEELQQNRLLVERMDDDTLKVNLKGTVAHESPPVSHEPGTDTAEIEIAVQEPDLPQANPLQLEEELQRNGLLVERMDDDILRVNLSGNGVFSFDSTRIRDDLRPALEKLADILRNRDKLTIQVVGHADSSGAAEYNLHLSQLRAKAVVDYLVNQGLTDSSIQSEGRGDHDTRLEHSTSYNPGLKRRVEIYIRRAQEK